MKYKKLGILVCLIVGVIGVIYIGKLRGIPFVRKQFGWSIGIYMGESPFNIYSPANINNPVLTAKDVTDVPAEFVADPFMVKEGRTWYMFFEVMNARSNQGDIGLAISADGFNWAYKQIVLDESFSLAYPYIFKFKDEYYMIPDSYETNSIRLYKAINFPTQWSFVKIILKGEGRSYVDSCIFYFNDKWWLFTASPSNDILYLYYADDLTGPWVEHPKSPVVKADAGKARPAGRVLIFDGRIIRYAQDNSFDYGRGVRAFEITELTTVSYKEKEIDKMPLLKASGLGWNAKGMHHADIHQTDKNRCIACVDGYREIYLFGLEY